MSDKPVCLVTAPVATRSGYGAHSRDICRALIKLDKYDVKIWPVRWGNTPMNALHVDDPNDKNKFVPVFSELISSKDGAGEGASAFKTSLNLSTAVPIVVLVAKSVKRPSS